MKPSIANSRRSDTEVYDLKLKDKNFGHNFLHTLGTKCGTYWFGATRNSNNTIVDNHAERSENNNMNVPNISNEWIEIQAL